MSIQSTKKIEKTEKLSTTNRGKTPSVEKTTKDPSISVDNDIKLAPKATKGHKPKNRKMAVKQAEKKLQANQWQATPQQNLFMESWLSPKSATFGNAYQSALLAGYSHYYATQLASPAINNQWLQEYKNRVNLTENHIKQGISELAISSQNSRSPDDTRLKAYETLARIHNMLDNRGAITVVNVQPILGGKSAPDIIDVEPS